VVFLGGRPDQAQGDNAMKRTIGVFAAGAVAVALIVGGYAVLGTLHDPGAHQPPSERQRFEDRYRNIRNGMTGREVDALLAGHKGSIVMMEKDGQRVPYSRSDGAVMKMYHLHSQVEEGDLAIEVYLDSGCRVVGKNLTEAER
jgi:hypothetical protein